jgi:predicted permease
MWTRIRLWLASLLRRRRFDADLADELEFHLRTRAEHWEARGVAAPEARRRARLEFGSVNTVSAEVRDVRRGAWVEHVVRDVRYGLRALRRHPGFSAMAVLSLAIGIGANTVIVGVVETVVFRESPIDHIETLVNVYETGGDGTERVGLGFGPMSYPNIEDLRKGTTDVFSGIAASTFAMAQIGGDGPAGTTVMGEAVTGGAFALLGIEPYLGRAIQPEDDVARGGHPVVMLSHGYWQRAFGSDPQVVGRTLRMGRRSYTIIGVAPVDYPGGLPALTPAFYVPMTMLDEVMGFEMLDERFVHNFFVKARLAPGVARVQAEHAASLVAASLTGTRPEGWIPGAQFALVPTSDVRLFPGVDPLLRAAAWLLMAVVGLVLLLACTNLASFLLARAIDRSQEVAVRRALGATRGALARQLLVESVLLGLGGAAAGLALAFALLNMLLWMDFPLSYGMTLDVHFGLDWTMLLDWKVLAVTAGAGVLAGVLLGVFPAIHGTRADLGTALKTGSRGSDAPRALKWRNVLVVAQVSMSLVLLVGAGLFLRSWQQTLAVDPGFGSAPTAILSVMVPVRQSAPDEAVRRTRLLLERFRAMTGVEAAGIIQPLPLEFAFSFTDFTIDGRVPPAGQETFRADSAFVDGGFFDAAGMDIVEGRTFNDDDRRDSRPVAVISRAMARRYWPDGGALGRVLRLPDPALPDLEIVGVTSDIMVRSLGEPPRDLIYTPYTQGPGIPILNFLVRTAGEPARMLPLLAAAGQEVVPDLRVVLTTTMTEHLSLSRLPSQIAAFLLSAFGVMALALASVGLYGMVRYTAAMRTREVGIRMALGAEAAVVTRLLAARGLRLVLVGSAIGVAASLLVARFLGTMLYGGNVFDPLAFAGAPLVLGAAAWLAAYLPARRASRVDPLSALRSE